VAFDPFNFVVTSLPIIAEYILVLACADEKIITKLLERKVIPCPSRKCWINKKWDCTSEISRQSNYLGLTVALTLTFIIGALLTINEWHRFFMIFFGVGVVVFYLVHLFMKEGKPEKPIGTLTKHASQLLAIAYLVIGLLVHYLFIAVF
jgi:hypothetical protein